jgi:hypothetical protein
MTFYKGHNNPVENNLKKLLNIFDAELSRRVPDQTEGKRSKLPCLTDSSPKDKDILRLLVHMGRFGGAP